jgi:hypothetical protein
MHTMVLTDQTQRQCACEHDCPSGFACPLEDCFSGTEVRAAAPPKARAHVAVRLAA